jgi:hypothetical protein
VTGVLAMIVALATPLRFLYFFTRAGWVWLFDNWLERLLIIQSSVRRSAGFLRVCFVY